MMTNTLKELNIYTDGACSNNQEKVNTGGWGYVCVVNEEEEKLSMGKAENTTNNKMELTAVIEALEYIKPNATNYHIVNIHADSNYVLKGITEWIDGWKRKGWVNSKKQPVANRELWEKLDQLKSEIDNRTILSWVKVKGHSGDKWNELADDLAAGRINLEK